MIKFSSTQTDAKEDKKILEKWRMNVITTTTAIRLIKQNNDIRNEISENEFVQEARQLGYYRR